MDLGTVADELYGISPDEFVARRTELVAEARAGGDRALATEIGQLRKPTRTAWLVNLLARSAPDRITELLELGRQLQDAQRSQSAAELRRLSARRRATVDALARDAAELGRSAGYSPPESAVQEIGQTLQAALADPDVTEQVRHGRLVQAATYGGFGPLPTEGRGKGSADEGSDLLAALTASVGRAKGRGAGDAETQKQARQQAQRDLADAKQSWEAASRKADEAASAADQASDRADDLAAEIESIRGRLRAAEAAERDARAEARAARKRALQLRQGAAAAEQRVNAARETLEALA